MGQILKEYTPLVKDIQRRLIHSDARIDVIAAWLNQPETTKHGWQICALGAEFRNLRWLIYAPLSITDNGPITGIANSHLDFDYLRCCIRERRDYFQRSYGSSLFGGVDFGCVSRREELDYLISTTITRMWDELQKIN